ncbi:hypothetical protein FQA39_LY01264 [Lamprigera yunnana]|nr:hypothetical protein FQA39_LY01264 [Lamprigera yunnana]
MGSYLSEPITEKISTDEANDKLLSGASSMQGWRISQEDAHNCILDFDENTALFAVYDGHGGHEVAHYCSQKLPEFIKQTESYKNENLEKALIDAFLGFDATIASPEVIIKLKEIAGVKEVENETDSSDVEENVSNLYEEATMPLEQVIEKYTSNLKHPHLQKEADKLPSSPYLRARKDTPNTSKPCSSVDEGGSSSKIVSSSCASTDIPDTDAKEKGNENKEASTESKNVETKSEENDDEKPLQNGEAPALMDEANSTEDMHPENGEILCKRKGKALTKTKGVDEKKPIKTRPKRNAQQLYINLLDLDSDSESEDEEDGTFQGPTDDSSDDTIETKLNEADNSEDGSEVDEGEDETDEFEEEDIDEDEGDDDEDEMEETDLDFARNMREEPGSDSGCTAVVALLRGNQLFVANAGDSRCIVCRKGKAIDMSVDHKPEDDLESQRIIKAGGKVTSDGRVNGGLNLSRAIGDHAYKQKKELSDCEQMITALPDVRTLTINPGEDEFMVLACDGIWNFMSSQQVVDFVKNKLENAAEAEKLSKICEEMFDYCLAPNTMCDGTGCDNMTAIVVQFKSNLCKRAAPADEKLENVKRIKTDQPDTTS